MKNSCIFATAIQKNGPFVYRLGRQVFILVRGVRFPHGLQNFIKNKNKKNGKS
jgi:hypothetical protein